MKLYKTTGQRIVKNVSLAYLVSFIDRNQILRLCTVQLPELHFWLYFKRKQLTCVRTTDTNPNGCSLKLSFLESTICQKLSKITK